MVWSEWKKKPKYYNDDESFQFFNVKVKKKASQIDSHMLLSLHLLVVSNKKKSHMCIIRRVYCSLLLEFVQYFQQQQIDTISCLFSLFEYKQKFNDLFLEWRNLHLKWKENKIKLENIQAWINKRYLLIKILMMWEQQKQTIIYVIWCDAYEKKKG